tara:strand:- start:514 stop:774 length:261 start_codon:yes stop_codon:yes gene_type:complete
MAIKTPKKFSPEELKEVTDLQENFNKVTFRLGQLYINRTKLEEQEILLKTHLSNLEKEEKELAKKFTDKYGKGNLDIDTGEFIPIE